MIIEGGVMARDTDDGKNLSQIKDGDLRDVLLDHDLFGEWGEAEDKKSEREEDTLDLVIFPPPIPILELILVLLHHDLVIDFLTLLGALSRFPSGVLCGTSGFLCT
jgi:hypothetical protein